MSFAAAVREGSISRAGRLLGMSPAAVAKSVASLERMLNSRLLLRGTRPLVATELGCVLLRDFERLSLDMHIAIGKFLAEYPCLSASFCPKGLSSVL